MPNLTSSASSLTKLFDIMFRQHAGGSRVVGLDWLRGLAALWVVLHHVDITIQKAKYFGAPSLGIFAEAGYRGVELFFVLSGFVMAASTPITAKLDFAGMGRFLTRRVLRVFPAYLSVFLALYIVAVFTGQGAPETGDMGLNFVIKNLFLLPRDDLTTYMPVVSWTLTHELMFYGVFSLVFIRFYIGVGLLAIWAGLCLAVWASGYQFANFSMQLNLLNAYFIIGVTAFHLSKKFRFNMPLLSLVSIAMLATAIALEGGFLNFGSSSKVVMTVLYGAGFTLIVIAAPAVTVSGFGFLKRILNFLGQHSYGIYLIHYPIVVIFAILMSKLGVNNPEMIFVTASIIASLIASWVLYRLVEAPFINLARHLTSTKKMDVRHEPNT